MHILEIMKTHPGSVTDPALPLIPCIEACFDSAQATVACADACLAEADPGPLARCIRINGECADIAAATGRLLSRRVPTVPAMWIGQLEACATAARMCAEECEKHADTHDFCNVCANTCRKCERTVGALLTAFRALAPGATNAT